ncbi:MAG: biotin--[acetyl-CoA-carboxylase] ligase [Nitriliruptorales bacterium]|nr:biotin--[acetyl-CoA-carboxylase] ligase [Nitriliruptorales bacterium]
MTHPSLDALIDGASPWSEVVHLEEVDSTNDEVLRRVREDPRPGVVVVADHQTAGRGRLERTWEDEPGRSLLVSVVDEVPDESPTLVPHAAGVAVVDALRRVGARAALKWPNDVLIGDRKVAGILVERQEVGATPVVVIGVGINVDWRGVDHPDGWTSVGEETDGDVDRWELLASLLRSLESWMTDLRRDPSRLVATYRARCGTIGQDVRVVLTDDEVAGHAVGVAEDGALLLETTDGRKARVTAGDIVHVRRRDG